MRRTINVSLQHTAGQEGPVLEVRRLPCDSRVRGAIVSDGESDGDYLLRARIVNFRTRLSDVQETVGLSCRLGREIDAEMRPARLH